MLNNTEKTKGGRLLEPYAFPIEIPSWLLDKPDPIFTNYEFLAGIKLTPLQGVEKPSALRINPGNIPQELKARRQWVCWKYEWNGKKWTKPPFKPDGFKASKTNPRHYSGFEKVLVAYEKGGFDGIGFVLTDNDPFVAIDIDKCLDEIVLTAEAEDIIKTMDSYTEISPSGTGIRIFVKGNIPKNVKRGIEIYSHAWYVTVTGRRWRL